MIKFDSKPKFTADATIVLTSTSAIKGNKITTVNASTNATISNSIKAKLFTGALGQIHPCTNGNKIVLLIGLGKPKEITGTSIRTVMRSALLSSSISQCKNVEILIHEKNDQTVHAVIDAFILGTYSWDKYKSNVKVAPFIKNRAVTIAVGNKPQYAEFIKIADGTNLARDLVNENADVATSSYIEKTIKSLVKGKKNCKLEILNKKELKAKGLGLHLAVNQGSANEPKLVIVKYTGATASKDYTAVIGKGITFDTGGLNLKPTGSIETMRMDMGGTAAVVGTLKSVLDLKLKKNIIFVCGLAENVTGSLAYKPGDVIKGYAGKTVEVLNTDAEGRLVLADAISYVNKNYKPKRIIDIATLTGAVVVALGNDYTGLVTADDKLARNLVQSSNATDDRIWRLPTYPELKNCIDSKIADVKNLGFPRGAGGTITAAEFLRRFTDGTTWAHLDIAGTAHVDGDSRWYFGHGATGAGVRLLTHYLKNN